MGPGAQKAIGARRRPDPADQGEDPPARPRSIPVTAEPSGDRDWSSCYAPHASMYFDQFGKVRACCQASGHVLGDVATSSIREIWESASASDVRTALEHGSYDHGCDFCAWQEREGNQGTLFARGFDHLRPGERQPMWPKQMELALTNACNLQCVMCNGNWSSSIRTHREGRPPMAAAYDDAFFTELATFLPHLDSIRFFGGEPFLGAEPLRVMEMLADLDRPPRVTLTTNGTICTDRVKRIVRRIRPEVVVSIDGASTDTFDAIRVGAHLPDVLANLDWFCTELGAGRVSLAHCLMTSNWHEFDALLAIAEGRGLDVGVNVVRFPAEQSLYHLAEEELAPIVEAMIATDPPLTGSRLAIWAEQVAALQRRLAALGRGSDQGPQDGMAGGLAIIEFADDDGRATPPELSRWPWLPFPEAGPPGRAPEPASSHSSVVVRVGTDGVLRCKPDGPVRAFDVSGLDGMPFESLIERLSEAYGPPTTWSGPPRRSPEGDHRVSVDLQSTDPAVGSATLRVDALRDHTGRLVGATYTLTATGPRS